MFLSVTSLLCATFGCFPFACFRVEVQLSRWLFSGRNVLGRSGCLTKISQGTQTQRDQISLHDIFTFRAVVECSFIVATCVSNKLTNNCSHLRIAQVGAVVSHGFPSKILSLWTAPFWVCMRSYKYWVLAKTWLFL